MDTEILNITTIDEYNKTFGFETLHPQVSVVDFSKNGTVKPHRMNIGFYALFLKEGLCGDLLYGRGSYDYQEGTIVSYAPGQVVGLKNVKHTPRAASSIGILFSPEFIRGTSLGQRIKEFSFFSYSVNEALHLSDEEKEVVKDCIRKIQIELEHAIDKHSKRLIAMNIELLLDYCMRFYERQFITRSVVNKDALVRFEQLIDDYFLHHAQTEGLPSVAYFADKICLSANYFGDLIKKETGKSAIEYIQLKTMAIAKDMLTNSNKTVTEIAYELGFQYPQHFVRSFKKRIGCTPTEYRLQA
jgi:AraC-like DNA-binding protein